jgi:hypothetical protein
MKEQDVRAIPDFYNPQNGKVKRPERIFVNGKFKRPNEVINMTYWKTKEDSDANYSQDKTYAAILEKTVSLRDGAVEMTYYTLANFRIG